MTVLCQWCGALNPDERELCQRCGLKLMVFSGEIREFGEAASEDEELEQEGLLLDENMLERMSTVEDTVRRQKAMLERLERRVDELEQGLALLDAGMQALIELLDRRRVLRESEVMAAWERSAASDQARQELLDKLKERKELIISRTRVGGTAAAAACARALQAAELALVAGQPERAAEVLAEALRRGPPNPELAMLLGEMAFERQDGLAAERHFRQVLAWDPGNAQALIFLGTLLAERSETDEAAAALERAAALAPDSFLPHFCLGALHAASERFDEARRHLAEAARRDANPQVLFLLGVTELDAGRPAAAVTALERAVMLDGEFEDAVYHLGLAYLERGWTRRARDCFQRVLAMDPQRLQYQQAIQLVESGAGALPAMPEEAAILMREASEAAERGELEVALARLGRARRVADHPSVLASQALLASAAGHHRQALEASHALLRQRVRGAPQLAAWTAVLETLRATRRFRSVEEWGGRLFREGPGALERAIAAYELAQAELDRAGDVARAEEFAHASLQLIPRELRHYPLATLGRIHLVRNEFSDAVDYLEQAAALSPVPAVLTQLGLALLGMGEAARAREVLQRARQGSSRDLKTDMLSHLSRLGALRGRGRRKG